jgi:hypothetical protein
MEMPFLKEITYAAKGSTEVSRSYHRNGAGQIQAGTFRTEAEIWDGGIDDGCRARASLQPLDSIRLIASLTFIQTVWCEFF